MKTRQRDMAELYAWTVLDEDGDERIIISFDPVKKAVRVFQGDNKQLVEELRPLAVKYANTTGRLVRLVTFTRTSEKYLSAAIMGADYG